MVVCTFAMTRLENPATAGFLSELFNDRDLVRTEKSIDPDQLKKYLSEETARGIRKEDTMNHFWEIDNKLVEDTLFWEEAKLDLTKIR